MIVAGYCNIHDKIGSQWNWLIWIIKFGLYLSLLWSYMYIHNSNSSIKPHPGGWGWGIYFQDWKTGCVCVAGGGGGGFFTTPQQIKQD